MRSVACPDHGETVLHLAKGALDRGGAARAESIRVSCDRCSSWWAAELEGKISQEIDLEIQKAILAFEAPQTKKTVQRESLAAVAAAVILVFGVMILAPDSRVRQKKDHLAIESSASVSGESGVQASDPDLILAEGFETISDTQTLEHSTFLEIGGDGSRSDSLSSAGEESSGMIFRSGLELGGLEAWSDHS